jgi:hypothetical protein
MEVTAEFTAEYIDPVTIATVLPAARFTLFITGTIGDTGVGKPGLPLVRVETTPETAPPTNSLEAVLIPDLVANIISAVIVPLIVLETELLSKLPAVAFLSWDCT